MAPNFHLKSGEMRLYFGSRGWLSIASQAVVDTLSSYNAEVIIFSTCVYGHYSYA